MEATGALSSTRGTLEIQLLRLQRKLKNALDGDARIEVAHAAARAASEHYAADGIATAAVATSGPVV